jgi:hypothetical protein
MPILVIFCGSLPESLTVKSRYEGMSKRRSNAQPRGISNHTSWGGALLNYGGGIAAVAYFMSHGEKELDTRD